MRRACVSAFSCVLMCVCVCVSLQFRLVVKTALKLLLVFVEYTEANAALLIQAVNGVDTKRGKTDTPTSGGQHPALLDSLHIH